MKNFRIFFGIFVLCLGLLDSLSPGFAATFFGETPPEGLIELKEYSNPVYVFVPPGHDGFLVNSMVLLIPDSLEVPDALVQEWLKIAKKKNLIVAVPALKMNPADVPYRTDEWILKLKKDLVNRYHIGKTYLIGKGVGAHYSAYLAMQHPEEFSGIGLIDGSWVGDFEKLIQVSGRPAKQVPFFVSLHAPEASKAQETEKWGYQLSAKGYPLYMEKFGKDEKVDSVDLKMRMINWLQKKAESWAEVVANSGKTKKEKISNWLGEFISSPVHH